MIDQYLEKFVNEFGEYWWFNYNEDNDMGIIWSDDSLIYGEKFYVFNGVCQDLILSKEEKEWIKIAWEKYSKYKNNYLDINTEFNFNNSHTYLINNYCPLCLKQRDSFESHHCIPASEGGSDDYVNKLVICKSCHGLITNGCEEDSRIRHLSAIYHQQYIYGIDFFKMNPINNKRYKNEDMGLYENRPYIKEILDYYENLNESKKVEFSNKIKENALYYYKYYRSIIRNIIEEN